MDVKPFCLFLGYENGMEKAPPQDTACSFYLEAVKLALSSAGKP